VCDFKIGQKNLSVGIPCLANFFQVLLELGLGLGYQKKKTQSGHRAGTGTLSNGRIGQLPIVRYNLFPLP